MVTSLFTWADIFFIPHAQSAMEVVQITNFQHMVAMLIPIFMLVEVQTLTLIKNTKIIKLLIFASVLLLPTLMGNLFFIPNFENYSEVDTTPYYGVFAVFMMAPVFLSIYQLITSAIKKKIKYKQDALVVSVGYGIVLASGILDMLTVSQVIPYFESYAIYGLFGFSSCGCVLLFKEAYKINSSRISTLKDLKIAYEELGKVKSLSDLGQKTTYIAHDVKNSCAMIQGYADVLASKTDDEKIIAITEKITKVVEKTTHMAHEIAAFARTSRKQDRHPLNLHSLLEQSKAHYAETHKAKIIINWLTVEKFILGDWEKLERVFNNLVKNSIEAQAKAPMEINMTIQKDDLNFVLIYEDNGVGLSEEDVDHIMEPFYSTKGTMGTGLGLPICKNIIQNHGGSFEISTKNKKGSSATGIYISIKLPLCTDLELILRQPEKKVLLISSNKELIPKLHGILSESGVQFILQDNPESTLPYIRDNYFSLILVDVFTEQGKALDELKKILAHPEMQVKSFFVKFDSGDDVYLVDMKSGKLAGNFNEKTLFELLDGEKSKENISTKIPTPKKTKT